jgi:hypothetical protein
MENDHNTGNNLKYTKNVAARKKNVVANDHILTSENHKAALNTQNKED